MSYPNETISIAEFIHKLEQFKKDAFVYYDFCDLVPVDFASWRGDYSQLALGWAYLSGDGKFILVKELLEKAHKAMYNQIWGYKGGCYITNENTKVWVDNYGKYSKTAIIDLVEYYDDVFIITKRIKE